MRVCVWAGVCVGASFVLVWGERQGQGIGEGLRGGGVGVHIFCWFGERGG